MTARTYDDIADWYADWVGDPEHDTFYLAVHSLLGDVAGLELCDLACGEGRIARFLAKQGARVVGIDSSSKLLDKAMASEAAQPLGVLYSLDNAESLATLSNASFDGVVSNMALMDIENLEATIQSVGRVLRPGGWFAFSILHPCFHTPASSEISTETGAVVRTVRGYWDEGYWRSEERVGPPGQIGAHHRTLSTYINALTTQGFHTEAMAEPVASGGQAERRPVWTEVPAVLSVFCRKSAR